MLKQSITLVNVTYSYECGILEFHQNINQVQNLVVFRVIPAIDIETKEQINIKLGKEGHTVTIRANQIQANVDEAVPK